MDVTRHLQSPRGVARGEQRPMDRLGAVQLPYPGELHLHELRLEPYCLEIQGHGLPDIYLLWEPWQGVEVHDELKALGIPRLRQERLGFGRVVAVEILEALVPVRVPDPRPDGTVKLPVVTHDAMRLHPTAQEVISNGLPIDGHVHGLPYLFLHKGHLRVELVRAGKVQPPKLPLVLDGRQFAGTNLHPPGDRVLLQ